MGKIESNSKLTGGSKIPVRIMDLDFDMLLGFAFCGVFQRLSFCFSNYVIAAFLAASRAVFLGLSIFDTVDLFRCIDTKQNRESIK